MLAANALLFSAGQKSRHGYSKEKEWSFFLRQGKTIIPMYFF